MSASPDPLESAVDRVLGEQARGGGRMDDETERVVRKQLGNLALALSGRTDLLSLEYGVFDVYVLGVRSQQFPALLCRTLHADQHEVRRIPQEAQVRTVYSRDQRVASL